MHDYMTAAFGGAETCINETCDVDPLADADIAQSAEEMYAVWSAAFGPDVLAAMAGAWFLFTEVDHVGDIDDVLTMAVLMRHARTAATTV